MIYNEIVNEKFCAKLILNINFLKNEHLYKMFVNKFLYYKLIKSLYNNYINLDY